MPELQTALIELVKANSDLIKVAVTLVSVVGGATFFFWKRLVSATIYIKDRYVNRLQVCVISDVSAGRLDDFIELYHQTFNSDERVSTKEIHDWLSWKAEHEGVQYRLYVTLRDSKAVAIAISFYDHASKTLFIPYMGVSDLDAQWKTTRSIVRAMVRAVSREARGWTAALVEIADPSEAGLPADEISRRRARIRRLKTLVAREGLEMLQVDLPYVQPSFANDVDQVDLCGMLLFALLKEKQRTELPRALVIEALDFIYNRIYRPSFCGTTEACAAYELDLKTRLATLGATLTDPVSLRS